MQYLGDYALGTTFDVKFVTTEPDTGAPATLSGTPVISAYVGNSTTQITAGITLSVDFDGVTGLNNVRVVASGGNGYTADTDVSLVITTGTVDGVSAVGYVIGRFTLSRATTVLVDTEAVLTDAEAILVDSEAIIADTESAITTRASILTDTEAVLADTEAATAVLTDTEALLVDTEATITDTEAILADTAELQTDWVNGGRLDLILDAILVDTEAGSGAILTDTEAILADTEAGGTLTQAHLGIHQTTIATLASQTSFTLTAGSADNDAYNGFGCYVRDASTSTQICLGIVDDYVGSTRTVTLEADPGIFTMATGDIVILLPAKLTQLGDQVAAILVDTEATVTDTEALLVDTEAAAAVLTDTESLLTTAAAVLVDTEAAITVRNAILVDTEATIADTEAAITARATILTDTEALLVDTEATITDAEAILADTNELQTDWANGGRLDLIQDAILVDTEAGSGALLVDTEAILADTEAAATSVGSVLTDTEALLVDTEAAAAVLVDTESLLTTAAAVLVDTEAATAVITDTEALLVDTEAAVVDTEAIKAKTDSLTFTVSGQVDANAESMNAAEILGDGTSGNKWRGE